MIEKYELSSLLLKKDYYIKKLSEMKYGAIDVRDVESKKYIYLHYRKNGKIHTKYAGEYSEELIGEIIKNNYKAKEINKELRKILKILNEIGYKEIEINENTLNNIEFINLNITEMIYELSLIENLNINYETIDKIIKNEILNNVTADNVFKINNIYKAYKFILKYCNIPSNISVLLEINNILEGNAITILGIDFDNLERDLEEIMNKNINDFNKAIDILIYLCKKQIFKSYNFSTAVIFINHFLITKGNAIFYVPSDVALKLKKLIFSYSNRKDSRILKKFLIEKCCKRITNFENNVDIK